MNRSTDDQIINAEIYRVMLSDRKYGLTVTLLATRSILSVITIINIITTTTIIIMMIIIIIMIIIRVLPVLIPQSVNPQLTLDQYLVVQNTIQEMFDHIDRWLMLVMRTMMMRRMMHMMRMRMMCRTPRDV